MTTLAPIRQTNARAAAARMRADLRAQIARLEARVPAGAGAASGGARILSVDELERMRDDLVRRVQESRFDGGEEQERRRILRERMSLDPSSYRGVTVSNAEVGEPGCTRWTNWFRLRISGGCP